MEKSNTFKLIIPEEVERKIRYICQQVWNNEWSGTLFYKPEGKFEDGSLVIRCIDIYVMDIGTTTYTEFDMSPDVIGYMTDNPDLLDCQMGLIHSHNNMNTFFSSTDTATLSGEGIDRNHFVSLIVNNKGTYTAAITRKVKITKTITENFSYPTFGDNKIVGIKTYEAENEELEWFYLKIEFEKDKSSFCGELEARLEEIKRAKAEKAEQLLPKQTVYTGGDGDWWNGKYNQRSLFGNEIPIDKKNTQQGELPLDYDYIDNEISDELPYNYVQFNKQTIKSLVLQLVTGSIIIPNVGKINAERWAQGMAPLYEKRFGKGIEGIKLFRSWAEGYIEFLCWFSKDDDLIEQGLDDDELAAACAYGIIEELAKLPKNAYIKEYINILERYLR